MLFWSIVLGWSLLGTAVFWWILNVKWSRIDHMIQDILDAASAVYQIPGHWGYWDLKFTLMRHAFVFLLSSVTIYFLHRVTWILTPVLLFNFLYAGLTLKRYLYRKKYVHEVEVEPDYELPTEIVMVPVRASIVAIVYSMLCTALLYVLFAIAP